jgi:citrate:succinate antiporter/L-tartrate/succinate antiporter
MKNIVKIVAIVIIGLIMSHLPAPEGLTQEGWIFFSLFVCVFIGLILEPLPSAYIALLGVVVACILKIGPSLDSAADVTS